MHLLQRKSQIRHTSLNIRLRWRDWLLQHDLGLLDHSNKKRFNFLRPLLKIVFLVNELLLLAEAFYIDEARRVFRTWTATKLWMARTAPATRDRQLELPTWSFLVERVWQCVFSSANSQQNWLRQQLSTRDTQQRPHGFSLFHLKRQTNWTAEPNCPPHNKRRTTSTNLTPPWWFNMAIYRGSLPWPIYGSFLWIVFLTIQTKCSSTKCELEQTIQLVKI